MKKVSTFMIVIILMLTFGTGLVMGATKMEYIEVALNSVNISVDGKSIDAPNIVYDGTTYVPLKAIAQSLGQKVSWDSKTRNVFIGESAQIKEPIKKENTTAGQIVTEFQKVGLDVSELEVYNESTDPNNLMGKPHQYISKANYKNGSIEVFENSGDAEARKNYIDEIGKSMSVLSEHSVVIDYVLVRFTNEADSATRQTYIDVVKKIVTN